MKIRVSIPPLGKGNPSKEINASPTDILANWWMRKNQSSFISQNVERRIPQNPLIKGFLWLKEFHAPIIEILGPISYESMRLAMS